METLKYFYDVQEPEKSIESLCSKIDVEKVTVSKNTKKLYLNLACALDLETTSYFNNGNVCGIMYTYNIGINGLFKIGRNWDSFLYDLEYIRKYFKLSEKRKLIIYIHNLSFDIQFFRTLINIEKCLIDNTRQWIMCYSDFIEFRCSYRLTNLKLENLAKKCFKYPCKKMVGDLDYKLIRHEKTPLTDKELKYIYEDVKIIMNFIQELIEQYQDISKIPLTQTGFVRKLLKQNCLNKNNYATYHNIIKQTYFNSLDEYKFFKSVYQGAFTGANPLRLGRVQNNVSSIDFESSYPFHLTCFNEYPITKFRTYHLKSYDDFKYMLRYFACAFTITFYNIESKYEFINVISKSKCFNLKKFDVLNGKITEAEQLSININNIDFKYIEMFYTWEKIEITNFIYAQKGYLPKEFIKTILDLFCDKTTLKGVEGQEAFYMNQKERLNSCYGDTVTDQILRCNYNYIDNNIVMEELTEEEAQKNLIKYNNSKSRYNFYCTGIWCTSLSKLSLFINIEQMQNDFVYSDTDSIKFTNFDRYIKQIEKWNKHAEYMQLKMLNYYKLDVNKYLHPKDAKGNLHTLGGWSIEESYKKFKTLGAKRYFYQYQDGHYSFTIAGLNKGKALDYILEQAKKEHKTPFDFFDDEMYIPKGKTGKNTHFYIDYDVKGTITDYTGQTIDFDSPSSVYLEESEFTLNEDYNILNMILYNEIGLIYNE